jgi:hypothetical protein
MGDKAAALLLQRADEHFRKGLDAATFMKMRAYTAGIRPEYSMEEVSALILHTENSLNRAAEETLERRGRGGRPPLVDKETGRLKRAHPHVPQATLPPPPPPLPPPAKNSAWSAAGNPSVAIFCRMAPSGSFIFCIIAYFLYFSGPPSPQVTSRVTGGDGHMGARGPAEPSFYVRCV